MATATITGSEITRLRSKVRESDIGTVFARVFHVAYPNLDTLPARGDLVTRFTGGASSDLLKPRVTNVKYMQQKPGAFQDVQITFLQPVILAEGGSTDYWKELRSSRILRPGQFRTEGIIIGVCSDRTHADVPVLSDIYPGDESANLPRVCYSAPSDPSTVPGLFFVTAKFRGSVGV